jgi:transcriptional regulator with XRE-family HTH domain
MMTLAGKTADRAASEAAWMAGLRFRPPNQSVPGWRHWVEDSNLFDQYSSTKIEWPNLTALPDCDCDFIPSPCVNAHPPYSCGVMLVADEPASFVLATQLLRLTTTPSSMQPHGLVHDVDVIPLRFVFNNTSGGITTPTDLYGELHDYRPRVELHVVAAPRRGSRAFEMFSELRDWLNLTTQQTASLVGIGRTTALAWERDGREPRAAHARRLYQVHSIIGALVKRLGRDAATEWLELGTPSPQELLERGDITDVARSAEQILLHRRKPTDAPEREALVVDEIDGDAASTVVALRGTRRRRRRKQGAR